MKVAKLIAPDGEVIVEVRVPDTMQEVRLEQYVNFLKAMEPIQESDQNYIPNVVKAISEFYNVDMNTLLTVRFKGKESQAMDSLAPLYWHTHKLISEYNPTLRKGSDLKIKYRKQSFTLRGMTVKGTFDDLTVLEAYECLEAKHLFQDKDEEGLDVNGNYLYTRYLRIIATLCRKQGEDLPMNDLQRERFIGERIEFFRDIDAATAMDVDFFLSNSLGLSDPSLKTVGFLSRQSLAVVAETRFRKQKPLPKPSRTAKRSLKGSATGGR
jgi:hypothetical protein